MKNIKMIMETYVLLKWTSALQKITKTNIIERQEEDK